MKGPKGTSDEGRAFIGSTPLTREKPIKLSLKDGSIHVPEFPQASHVGQLTSENAELLGALHLVGHYLDEASAALVELRRERIAIAAGTGSQGRALLWALCTAFVIPYCRTFRTKGRDYRLVASEVFAHNSDALREHEYIWALRDKHFAHDVNDRRRTLVSVILDAKGDLLKIATNQMIADESEIILHNGTLLVQDSRRFLDQSIEQVELKVLDEVQAMTPLERLALPEPVYVPARGSAVAEGRKGTERKR